MRLPPTLTERACEELFQVIREALTLRRPPAEDAAAMLAFLLEARERDGLVLRAIDLVLEGAAADAANVVAVAEWLQREVAAVAARYRRIPRSLRDDR